MSLQAFVWAVRSLTLLCFIAFVALVLFLDPDVTSWYGDALFYGIGSLTLLGIFSLFFIGAHRIFFGDEQAVHQLLGAWRQAVLTLLFLILLLALFQYELLYWWSALFSLALVLLLEFTFRPATAPVLPEKGSDK